MTFLGSEPIKVMVVEDDAPLRLALAASLTSHGYAVVEAGSAEEAIVLADYDPSDLVLLDLTLPGADGLHALRRLECREGGRRYTPAVIERSSSRGLKAVLRLPQAG